VPRCRDRVPLGAGGSSSRSLSPCESNVKGVVALDGGELMQETRIMCLRGEVCTARGGREDSCLPVNESDVKGVIALDGGELKRETRTLRYGIGVVYRWGARENQQTVAVSLE